MTALQLASDLYDVALGIFKSHVRQSMVAGAFLEELTSVLERYNAANDEFARMMEIAQDELEELRQQINDLEAKERQE